MGDCFPLGEAHRLGGGPDGLSCQATEVLRGGAESTYR